MSPYGWSQRRRDDEFRMKNPPVDEYTRHPGASARRSPLEHWDQTYDLPPPDIPPPKTPSASPGGGEEPFDRYPVAPAPTEAAFDKPPPSETVKSERQTAVEDAPVVPDYPPISSAEGGTKIKTEKFDVIAPAFDAVECAVTVAPSQDDIQAILSQAHSSSKATVSAQKVVDMRKKKWKEEKPRIKREVKEQRLAGDKDHVSSRPSTTSRLKNISASSILSMEAKKAASAGLVVTSGKYKHSRPVSSGDDSEEVDVDTVTDDSLSTLLVSISLHHLPAASQLEVMSKSSLDSGFHTGSSGPSSLPSSIPLDVAVNSSAKKRRKKKKEKKKKDKEESVSAVSQAQTEGAGGIKLKINLTKKESSLYE